MKIAISGKGGVGKTTLAALLAQTYADRGRAVLAVDSDPSPSLARALAFPDESLEKLRPIAEMDELIEEVGRTAGIKEDQGALVVDMAYDDSEPPMMLRKRDGATLYATRDIAAAIDRFNWFNFIFLPSI